MDLRHDRAAEAAGSLSRSERGGVRGYKPSIDPNPLTPTLSTTELGYTRVRSLNDVAEVGNIRLRLGRGSPAVPRLESVPTNKACVSQPCFRPLPPSAIVPACPRAPGETGSKARTTVVCPGQWIAQ